MNFGGLAGPTDTCPQCFNNTDSHVVKSNSFIWPVANCDDYVDDNRDEIYFSVQGIADDDEDNGNEVAYSVSIIVSAEHEPLNTIPQNEVLVDSIAGLSTKNYSADAVSSSDSPAYLLVTLTQVNYDGHGDLTLGVHNTSNLNCMLQTASYYCTANSTGYCSIVVQACDFLNSDGWIVDVVNTDATEVHYNLFFELYSAAPVGLTNNIPHSGSIISHEYDQFEYFANGGDTLIVEVFFDSCYVDDDDCEGALYVSTDGPAGPEGCFSNVFSQTGSSKCVYAVSACDLPSQNYYFSITSNSDLTAQYPLSYTIKITEQSYVMPTAVNIPTSALIYPNQKIYHTFSYTNDPSAGTRFKIVIENGDKGVVSAFLAEGPPPSASGNCPCFEYGYELEQDYCDFSTSTTNEYTVMTQVTSSTASNEQIGYVITILSFNEAPKTLTIGAPFPDALYLGMYNYYAIDLSTVSTNSNAQISLSLTNIDGGLVEILLSDTNTPATPRCNSGTICKSSSSSCLVESLSCDGYPTYFSVHTTSVDSYAPVTYTIEVDDSLPVTVKNNNASPVSQLLEKNDVQYFYFDASDVVASYISPQVTFTVNNAANFDGSSISYSLKIFEDGLCGPGTPRQSCPGDTCSISISTCTMSNYFYLSVTNGSPTGFNFTVTPSAVDLSVDSKTLTTTPRSITLAGNDYASFTIDTTDAGQIHNLKSLSYTITTTSQVSTYFGLNVATPGCSDYTKTVSVSDTHVVSACCIADNTTYVLLVENKDTTSANITAYIEYINVMTTAVPVTMGTTFSKSYPIFGGETQEFALDIQKSPTSFGPFWYFVESDTSANIYFVENSLAGPNNDGNACSSYDTSVSQKTSSVYTNDQCSFYDSSMVSNAYAGGEMFVGVQNPNGATNVTSDFAITITSGFSTLVPLVLGTPNTTPPKAPLAYYSFNISEITATKNIAVDIVTNATISATLSADSQCAPSVAHCNANAASQTCSMVYVPCSSGNFIVSVSLPPQGATTFSITANFVERTTFVSLSQTGSTQTGSIYARATLPQISASQYAQVKLDDFAGNSNSLQLKYSVEGVPVCSENGPTPVCIPIQNSSNQTCFFTFDSCLLSGGSTYNFELTVGAGDSYSVSFNVLTQQSEPVQLNSIVTGTVTKNQRMAYNLTADFSQLLPGMYADVLLNVSCGSASLYFNQGGVAGPDCSFATNNLKFDACSLASGPIANDESLYQVSVIGDSQSFVDEPAQYLLEFKVSGTPIQFLPVGDNQVIPYTPNTYFVYPVTGFNDFVGQLEVVLTGTTGSLDIAYDTPFFCGNPNYSLSVATPQLMSHLFLEACDLDSVRSIYFSLSGSSDAAFELVHVKPFIRDLDVYTTIPQQGAVVPSNEKLASSTLIDEEFYRISLPNPSTFAFQFTAWLDTFGDDSVQIMSAQNAPPSLCSNLPSNQVGSVVTWDWCDVSSSETMYLTVNHPSSSVTPSDDPKPYDLYYSTMFNGTITTLQPNQPICDTLGENGWSYFTLSVESISQDSVNTVEIYAIGSDQSSSSLTYRMAYGGLATESCTSGQNTQTCTSACEGASCICKWDFACQYSGNISYSVQNPGKGLVNYYIVWRQETLSAQSVTVPFTSNQTPDTATTYYYAATLPTIDPTSQVVVAKLTTGSSDVSLLASSERYPSGECNDGGCSGDCYILINQCSPQGVEYFAVSGSGDYTLDVYVYNTTSYSLPLDTFKEVSFPSGADISIATFTISITQEMLDQSVYGDMSVSIYGVTEDIPLEAWIAAGNLGSFASSETCRLDSATIGQSGGLLVVRGCAFTAGDYFVSVMRNSSTIVSCANFNFGIMATMGTVSTPVTSLTNGQVYEQEFSYTMEDVYNYQSSAAIVSLEVSTSAMNAELVVELWDTAYSQNATLTTNQKNSCMTSVTNSLTYFWGCNPMPEANIVVSSSSSKIVLPGSTYSIVASDLSFVDLGTPATGMKFSSGSSKTTHFYTFANEASDSVQIDLEVTSGTAVTLEIWDVHCVSHSALLSMDCFSGHCLIPFSWANGDLFNSSRSYYLTVSGYYPSTYNLNVDIGEDSTCYEPDLGDDALCSDVTWSIWNFETTNGTTYQENSAARLYNQLVDAFCPPCGCVELSSACNSSLIQFACTQTFRACGSTGLQTSVCGETCEDIENNCGYTFEQVNLPEFSCNHNFYYSDSDEVCTEIYGIDSSSGSSIWLWIILSVVIVAIILAILAVVAFFGYKKYKARSANGNYEEIANNESL
mmetsp:Transcript_62455/g.94323  ORF Transcript_62455/g.94323 Transcript_62455/m.94323 type:complete len:2246 (-) Transcript_62455:51-6788(-)